MNGELYSFLIAVISWVYRKQ